MDEPQSTTHYVCKKCGGLSNNPKNCETEGCEYNGKPLVECNCTDGEHKELKEEQSEDKPSTDD